MAFTIRLCPYCGGEIVSDDAGYYICQECEKRTFRSRSNTKAFLQNKPYEEDYTEILNLADSDPKKALKMIETIINDSVEPNTDMLFTRGIIFANLGEEGRAHNDWKKGLDLIQDLRFIDSYIVAICKHIVEIICMKEREFIEFNPIEYIDSIATEFSLKAKVPCKGIFYITTYRNFRMKLHSGDLDDDEDIYPAVIPKILSRIIAYGRDFRTQCNVIEEILEDFHYDPDRYVEDDNMNLHVCDVLRQKYTTLSENFSDEHITRIFRHWNDENMFELEYWVSELMSSVKDDSILQKLRSLGSPNKENYNVEQAVEDYARKYLLLSDDGKDLSEEP